MTPDEKIHVAMGWAITLVLFAVAAALGAIAVVLWKGVLQ